MQWLHYKFQFSSTIFLYQSEAYHFTCLFPMNNHLRYMQFLCITDFFNNNDVTLRRNECDNLDNLRFFKITLS